MDNYIDQIRIEIIHCIVTNFINTIDCHFKRTKKATERKSSQEMRVKKFKRRVSD